MLFLKIVVGAGAVVALRWFVQVLLGDREITVGVHGRAKRLFFKVIVGGNAMNAVVVCWWLVCLSLGNVEITVRLSVHLCVWRSA